MVSIIEKISKIDKHLKELSYDAIIKKKHFIGCLCVLFFTLIYLLVILFLDVVIYVHAFTFHSVARYIAYCMPLCVSTIVILQFCTMVYMIKLWLFKINYVISTDLPLKLSKPANTIIP